VTATLTQIRSALANQIATQITGLRASEEVPAAINPPMAVVGPNAGTFAEYEVTMGPNQAVVNWSIRVYLILSYGNVVSSQKKLDAYLSPTGSQSLVQAVNHDPSLGGVADFAVVARAQRYGLVSYNGVDYLGAEVMVDVSAS